MTTTETKKDSIDSQTRAVEVLADGSVTVSHAAIILHVEAQTVRNWIDKGLHHIPGGKGRGNVARVFIPEVVQWRVDRMAAELGLDDVQEYNGERAKSMRAHYEAISTKAKVCRELGMLVPVDAIANVVGDDYRKVRERLTPIGARLSVKVAAETDAQKVRRMIEDEIHSAQSELSDIETVIRKSGGDPSRSIHDPLQLDDVEEVPDGGNSS